MGGRMSSVFTGRMQTRGVAGLVHFLHYSWSTIRDITQNQVRVTTRAKCKDGQILYLRKSSIPNEKQKEILNALNLNHKAGVTTKVYK